MVAAWLDYAFRVYGQLNSFMQQSQWSHLHSAVLRGLMSDDMITEIDSKGRLIVIDHSNTSLPLDLDNDHFYETVVLTHSDAYSLLFGGNSDLISRIKETLGEWAISPSSAETAENQPTQLPQGVTLATLTVPELPLHDRTCISQAGLSTGPTDSNVVVLPAVSELTNLNDQPAQSVTLTPPKGIKFVVGSTVGAFQQREMHFFPGSTELNQLNIGIVGDLGTGKTQLIQALLYQLSSQAANNRGFRPKVLIFDYKKDYSKPEFIKATGARVVSPFSIPLNIFDTRDSVGQQNVWLERSKFFVDILDKIFSGIGPLQRQRIKQAVRQAYEQSKLGGLDSPTIYDVFEIYTAICDGQVDSPFSIMSDIVDGGYFVRDSEQIRTFSEFLDGVVVVDLGAVGQDDRTKNMLVIVFLNLFYEHMLRIEKKPFLGNSPRLRFVDTMILVDEADNIMQYEFDVLKRLLLQGREFGVGVVLASQYLSHFKTAHENYGEALLTWFVHKVPNITVRELESVGLTRVDTGIVERIKTLACHECLYKTYDVGGEFMRGKPFYEVVDLHK